MASLDVPPSYPPPPPPPRPVRPKITLQIPSPTTPVLMTPKGHGPVYFAPRFHPKAPVTPASHISDPHGYYNPFGHMYHSKASEFMFKQFEGFKDFTMNTAKSGLSAGEKSAFWFYNKLRIWSKRWFTHFFLTLCLVLYSVIGAAIFMALEGPNEQKYDKNITDVRQEMADRIRDIAVRNKTAFEDPSFDLLAFLENDLIEYEANYTEYMKHLNNNDVKKKTWSFWNSMFYAGTIYTTIVSSVKLGMSEEEKTSCSLTLKIPLKKAETEAQTSYQLVVKAPDDTNLDTMETDQEKQSMSLRKRRNLSKNRGQVARQREKTPEPGRTPIPHEDTPTSEEEVEEEDSPPRNPREIEADKTYREMKRMVQKKTGVKDPVYDIDTQEILEARVNAAVERRRRSISPFAIPDKEELSKLERKCSFIDPTNKLLSTNYNLSPKDTSRDSLVIETPPVKENKNTLSPTSSGTASPKENEFPYPTPSTPKKQEPLVYADEQKAPEDDKPRKLKSPIKKEGEVFTFDEKDTKPAIKAAIKLSDSTPGTPGEIVTRVIQVERVPSKKLLAADKKPTVEVRERIVRTPSRKMSVSQTNAVKQAKPKEEQQKVPPVKPARSKSATRIGNKTSESEMSEDQSYQQNTNLAAKRKVVPTPRRFQRNRSPKTSRSQSMSRPPTEVVKVVDRTGTGMSQTSKEIIELMAKARARSLSIPKDDPRLPVEYKRQARELKTPNKTPINMRQNRGISCPKTIQIISNMEILSGLSSRKASIAAEIFAKEKETQSRQSSGYVDASQSEITSSCYSSSPSENEYEFDLSERTAELTRKLNILSQEVDKRENNTVLVQEETNGTKIDQTEKPVLRKRSMAGVKTAKKEVKAKEVEPKEAKPKVEVKKKEVTRSRIWFISNWQLFKQEQHLEYKRIKLLRNRCICDSLLLVIMCGLGGMMFKTLEGSFENAYKCGTRNVKRDFIESLWRGSHYLREEDWKSMARKKLFEFEDQLHNAHEAGVTSYSGQRSWNFMNSFVYCMTLVTTIGYGHIAPKTTYGRVATIVYAIIGIPLFLIVLADFGKLFTRIIKFFWAFIRRFYYTRSCRKVRRTETVQEVMKGLNTFYHVVRRPSQIFTEEDETNQPPEIERKPSLIPPPLPPKPGQVHRERDIENDTDIDTPAPSVFEIDDEFNLPISVAIIILVLYILVGAVAYNLWESWDFFESFYFVFISMSTIGLGDLVPDHPMFMMASILYLVFGLALTSMCINVVQVKLSNTFKQASAKLGATIGLKVAEEDGSLVPITPPPTEIAPIHKGKSDVEDKVLEKSKEAIGDDTKIR